MPYIETSAKEGLGVDELFELTIPMAFVQEGTMHLNGDHPQVAVASQAKQKGSCFSS